MILAVGYRVRSHRGTQFRQWATARLAEFLSKGLTIDDERLTSPPGNGHVDYFDELLARIRDIRASQPSMGLQTTRPGGIVRPEDVSIAKNFLTEDELNVLNRIVTAYLEFAELQAPNRKPMTMREWVTKLDELPKLSGRELLDHAGKVSVEGAKP